MTALVVSGGGAACAFSVGVLSKLVARGIRFDKVFGISGGALVAAQAAFDGVEGLRKTWLGINGPSDFINNAFYTKFLWRDGYYSSKPLRKKLDAILAPGKFPICKVEVGFTDLARGEIVYADQTEPRAAFINAVLASASLPVIMETVDGKYTDGGVIDVTPLARAIDQGYDEIYVLLASPLVPKPRPWKASWPYAVSVSARSLELMADEIWKNDLKLCRAYNFDKTRRKIKLHVYEHNPREIDTFDFNNKDIVKAVAKGEKASCIICGV